MLSVIAADQISFQPVDILTKCILAKLFSTKRRGTNFSDTFLASITFRRML